MQQTQRGNESGELDRIAGETGFTTDAVSAMAEALRAGNGTMAQFNHPELGGFGQWSAGGMLMIGDMFNNGLKARVAHLADAVAASLSQGRLGRRSPDAQGFGQGSMFQGGGWWPEELGQPSSSGSQNGVRYAVFPDSRRLAIETAGSLAVYDTGDHWIGGVSQQQGGTSTLRFSSQLGSVAAEDLPRVHSGSPSGASTGPDVSAMADRDEGGRETAGHAPVADEAQGGSGQAGRVSDEGPATRLEAGASQAAGTQDMPAPSHAFQPDHERPQSGATVPTAGAQAPAGTNDRQGDPLDLLRRLSDLKKDGILTEEEFAAKKAEILARL